MRPAQMRRWSLQPTLAGLAHLCLPVLLCAGLPVAAQAQSAGSTYELAASINLSQGLVTDAEWLDSDQFLTLEASPDGAAVMSTSLSTLQRRSFMSKAFITRHICGPEASARLEMQISPGRRYIFFGWRNELNERAWTLVDISAAPQFRLRRFTPPAGMAIANVLFSSDDRYGIFAHDPTVEGSAVSLLVFDLKTGEEVWRIAGSELSFVQEMWWSGAITGAPRFFCTAKLYQGQFQDSPGLAVCNAKDKTVSFTSDTGGLLFGHEAIWGKVEAHRSTGGASPYFLRSQIAGQGVLEDIPLSNPPIRIRLLATPGAGLLSNRNDEDLGQLWLVDMFSGNKTLVDKDCADFSTSPDGTLLVRARKENELRVYDYITPADMAPDAPARSAPHSPMGGRQN